MQHSSEFASLVFKPVNVDKAIRVIVALRKKSKHHSGEAANGFGAEETVFHFCQLRASTPQLSDDIFSDLWYMLNDDRHKCSQYKRDDGCCENDGWCAHEAEQTVSTYT